MIGIGLLMFFQLSITFLGKSDTEIATNSQEEEQDVFLESDMKSPAQKLIKKKLGGKKGNEKKGKNKLIIRGFFH